MNPDASAADLISIEDDIVRLCAYFPQFSLFQKRKILFHRHGKRMMHRQIAVLLITPLKLRELCDPYKTVFVFVQKLKLTCQLHTQCSQRVPYYLVLIRRKQEQVPRLSIHGADQRCHLLFTHELREG